MSRVLDGVRHIFRTFVARIRRTGASRAGGVSGRVAPWYPDHFTKTILRPDDLLLLTFEFLNLRVDIDSAPTPQLVRVRAGDDAYVIIHFPPQHIAEQAFYEVAAGFPPPPAPPSADPVGGDPLAKPPSADPVGGDHLTNPPVSALLSDGTRIGLHVPSTTVAIPYTLEALLHWAAFDLNVTATALPDGPSPFAGTVNVPAGDLAGELAAAAKGNVERGPETASPFVPPDVAPGPLPGPGDPGFERLPGATSAGFGNIQEQSLMGAQQPHDLRDIQRGIQRDAQWEQLPSFGTPTSEQPMEAMSLRTDQSPASQQSTSAVKPHLPPQAPPRIAPPRPHETSIVVPYRLALSPDASAQWRQSTQPEPSRYELWRMLLTSPMLRPIWTPDYPPDPTSMPSQTDLTPFRMGLTRRDRIEIVRLSADYTLTAYSPSPLHVEQFALSTLGAWMKSRGVWRPPAGSGLSVEEWRQIANMGRDAYVRVVYKGYLFPFGHEASLIKVTERKFQQTPSGATAAYLRQRNYIVVREQEIDYTSTTRKNLFVYDGNEMPLRRVRITTLVTPNLDNPAESDFTVGAARTGQKAFWPRVATADFQFHVVAWDWKDQPVEFTAPLIFVSTEDNFATSSDAMTTIQGVYQDDSIPGNGARRRRPLAGQSLAYAPDEAAGSGSDSGGTTTLVTESITLGAQIPDAAHFPATLGNVPRFLPVLAQASIRLHAVRQLTGADLAMSICLEETFLAHGLDPSHNVAQVFARLVTKEPAPQISFAPQQSGGTITPNMNVIGLSRLIGPVGGTVDTSDESGLKGYIAGIAGGSFSPASYFDTSARVLGTLSLSDILESTIGIDGTDSLGPPTLTVTRDSVAQHVVTRLAWTTQQLKSTDTFLTDADTSLSISAQAVAPIPSSSITPALPSYDVSGKLEHFTLQLLPSFPCITIAFDQLTFTAHKGEKVDVSATLKSVEFVGPLAFLQHLAGIIPADGFQDPPNLAVDASGVTVGYTLAIPSIGFGVFDLQNISFGAQLRLPFNGDRTRLRLNFAERHHPFMLAVALFGGGGYFMLDCGLDGIDALEASLDFGGDLSFDIGVASGGVSVVAGITYTKDASQVTFTGFVRAGGALEVLGLVCLSVEFYMSLTYETTPSRVWGQATVSVEIDIGFFSKSVDLTMERDFAASPPPTFGDIMRLASPADPASALTDWDAAGNPIPSLSDWATYCAAFASIGGAA